MPPNKKTSAEKSEDKSKKRWDSATDEFRKKQHQKHMRDNGTFIHSPNLQNYLDQKNSYIDQSGYTVVNSIDEVFEIKITELQSQVHRLQEKLDEEKYVSEQYLNIITKFWELDKEFVQACLLTKIEDRINPDGSKRNLTLKDVLDIILTPF